MSYHHVTRTKTISI